MWGPIVIDKAAVGVYPACFAAACVARILPIKAKCETKRCNQAIHHWPAYLTNFSRMHVHPLVFVHACRHLDRRRPGDTISIFFFSLHSNSRIPGPFSSQRLIPFRDSKQRLTVKSYRASENRNHLTAAGLQQCVTFWNFIKIYISITRALLYIALAYLLSSKRYKSLNAYVTSSPSSQLFSCMVAHTCLCVRYIWMSSSKLRDTTQELELQRVALNSDW